MIINVCNWGRQTGQHFEEKILSIVSEIELDPKQKSHGICPPCKNVMSKRTSQFRGEKSNGTSCR